MKSTPPDAWERFRTADRPEPPELDVDAIMAAVRREAAAAPVRRRAPGLAGPIPAWACAAAAGLALLAAAGTVARSITTADDRITQAWLQSINPQDFETDILDASDHPTL